MVAFWVEAVYFANTENKEQWGEKVLAIILTIGLRAAIAYLALLVAARVAGRKMISQMTFFDFVLAITIGTASGSLALGGNNTITAGLTVIVVLVVLTLIVDYLHLKSFTLRKIFSSEPVVLMDKGRIVPENMRRTKFTVDELLMQLRKKNIFNINDVEFAVIETDGKLSVQPKAEKQPVTPSDLKFAVPYKGLTRDLIIDGTILLENLQAINLDEDWLRQQLQNLGISDSSKVFYAGLDTSDQLYVSLTTPTQETQGKWGLE